MRLLSVTSVRNEAPYLLEWIAWQQLIGITDLLVYSNDCDDGTDRLLDRLAAEGVLRHAQAERRPGKSIQWSALKAAWQHELRRQADWMLISDVDEFPVIHAGEGRIADLLSSVPENADAIALAWRLFGAGGVARIVDRPTVETFIRCAPVGVMHPIAATFFKSLFRPAAFGGPGVHRPRHKKDSAPVWINGSGNPMDPVVAENDKRLSLIGTAEHRSLAEMHHYSLRSAQSYLVKSERGLPNRSDKRVDLGYWVERNFNSEENRAAQRHLPQLDARIEALKGLPGVGELHQAGFDWHRTRFRHLLARQPYYDLFCQILFASDSAVLTQSEQISLLRMFSKVKPAE
ncbi:Glycosyl transferase family 2 [Paracoccus isoporae]|uniref:Glycosyl transferase family 2 n=1 Tax=Paracoccus isoporae TaxID=591205 RepID=A0A1G6UJF8_9RHOB|nr:glycosyltransferase family 2 protein [Paracoccus isoporae]SDD41560.1 Glycosyl transferase family 2 [Paracoccus isoporae]